MSVLNFKSTKEYKKPKLTQLDIDFSKIEIDKILKDEKLKKDFEINLNKSLNKIYKYIYFNNFEKIIEYIKNNKILYNISRQTPLMFASKIGNYHAVQILLNEHGRIDSYGNFAYDYAITNEIKELLEPFETF